MQVILADDTILFCDAFAFTRVDAKGKVKNVEKVVAYPRVPLSVGGVAPRAHVVGPYSYQSKVIDLSTFKLVARFSGGRPDGILPDGERLVAGGGFVDLAGAQLGSLPPRASQHAARVNLGGTGRFSSLSHRLRGGAMSVFFHRDDDCVVCLYDVGGHAAALRMQVSIEAPSGAIVEAWPALDGITLVAWSPHDGRATAVRLGLDGAERGRASSPSLSMPVVDGHRLVTQPDEAEVRSVPLGGDDPSTFSITKVTEVARAKRGAPEAPANEGVGLLVAARGRTCLVPWHAESLVDLDRAIEVDRKLPAKLAPLRAAITGWCKGRRAELLAHGLERLSSLTVSASGSAGITFWNGAYEGARHASKSQELVAQLAAEVTRTSAFRVGSYGSMG